LIVSIIQSTPGTNISTTDTIAIQVLKRSADVVGGECHSFVSFQPSHYKRKKGPLGTLVVSLPTGS